VPRLRRMERSHVRRRRVGSSNMLAGASVVSNTLLTYQQSSRLSFPRRLIVAMQAGEEAGGDSRGKQSACLIVFGSDEWSILDLAGRRSSRAFERT
jgi:uncharacterized Ntn-hydrolase superfamily protein